MSVLATFSPTAPFPSEPAFVVPLDGRNGPVAGAVDTTRDAIAVEAPARSRSKRVVDVVGAFSGLCLLSIVMLVVACLIKLGSRGPVLFRQRRLGQGGVPFFVLKFRTMVRDAERRLPELESRNESPGGVLFKMRHDPRVTPLGRFLRRTSLDELPQLLNVIRGQMSLVGPRPLQIRDCERLEKLNPEGYARRLSVPPGLTGAWQIGGRSEVDCNGMLRLDLDYINRWSLGLDLRIICRTVVVVLARRGAC
jgi:lipopolysaccharide/colanic/teichoic acid biosynthesis glycosyltransferase